MWEAINKKPHECEVLSLLKIPVLFIIFKPFFINRFLEYQIIPFNEKKIQSVQDSIFLKDEKEK